MRGQLRIRAVLPAAAVLSLICGLCFSSLPSSRSDWRLAEGLWDWSFPRDHGSHQDFRTEWWYFTGNLKDGAGNHYGCQLTFFRQGLRKEPGDPGNVWSVRDLYFAHFALTDVSGKRFLFAERASRRGPGLADAGREGLKVRLLDWTAVLEGNLLVLTAADKDLELSLRLSPGKGAVFHGDRGLSRKGPLRGQASYYYSLTDMKTKGFIRIGERAPSIEVEGESWFDHEFGSSFLSEEVVGWDWFSLRLSEGRELMIYLIRRRDGGLEPASSGTIVFEDGSCRALGLDEISVEVLDRWKSSRSGGLYPSRWRIALPSENVSLEIAPLIPDQELSTRASTGIIYWEGAVGGKGFSRGKPVTCRGYVELTGYAGSLGGIF